MATGADIVTAALRKLGIRTAESPLTASELADGLSEMNDMLAKWEGKGINFGFDPISSAADTVEAPGSAIAAIKSNLSIRLAPDYSRIVSQTLKDQAEKDYNDLLTSEYGPNTVEFPDTLPLGSGNTCVELHDQQFFPKNSKENF